MAEKIAVTGGAGWIGGWVVRELVEHGYEVVVLDRNLPPDAQNARGVLPRVPGQVSLALAVDDVAAAVEELRAKGVPIVMEPREQDVCYAAVIRAPDGNQIILHRRKDGTAG